MSKIYHKGKFRNGEWAKHLRPYGKREGNKRWRKAGKDILNEDYVVSYKKNLLKRTIKVKTIIRCYGTTIQTISKYRTLRDAQNAMKRGNVVSSKILG